MLNIRRVVLLSLLCILIVAIFSHAFKRTVNKVKDRTIVPEELLATKHVVKPNEIVSTNNVIFSEAPSAFDSTKEDVKVKSEKLNPGCENKELNNYRAHDVGKVYHHPPIVHYAKLGGPVGQLSFREYTSVLAAYKFVRPERIIFHINNGAFSGKYWDMVKNLTSVQVEVNEIPSVDTIGGRRVIWVQHAADFIKLSMIHKHGGIALDFDVIIINGSKLRNEQRISECVLSGEGQYINGGFYSCIRNSSFIAKWLKSYHNDYQPQKWLHNVSYRPLYILTDKESDVCYNVHLDDSICLKPHWGIKETWLKENSVEWRTKMAAHYYLKHEIPNDGEGLLHEHFPLAEMIQYVHNAST